MTEESDARIERLEKAHQDHQGKMAEMMELLRTLVKEKGQASSSGLQNEMTQHDQGREELVYPAGFTLPYTPNVHMAQAPPTQQARCFQYGYAPSQGNAANPI